jgi:hypothetical protein
MQTMARRPPVQFKANNAKDAAHSRVTNFFLFVEEVLFSIMKLNDACEIILSLVRTQFVMSFSNVTQDDDAATNYGSRGHTNNV